jgi:hypothetical protein
MRKLMVAALAVTALCAAATAQAGQKQRVVVERFSEPYELAIGCPQGFDILIDGTQRVRVTDVLSGDGELLQTVFQIGIQESNANSVSGAEIALKGAVHEVWDYASDTRTIDGKVWLATQPGAGTLFQDTGRITMDLDTRVTSFVAGPHEVFFGGGLDPMVCAVLAD